MSKVPTMDRLLNKYEIVMQAASMAREALKNQAIMHMGIEPYSDAGKQDKEIVRALKVVYQLNEKLKNAALT